MALFVRDEASTWYMPGLIINRRCRLFKLISKMQCTLEYWSQSGRSPGKESVAGGWRMIPEMGRAVAWPLLLGPASINSRIRWQFPRNTPHLWARIMHAWPWRTHEINLASKSKSISPPWIFEESKIKIGSNALKMTKFNLKWSWEQENPHA